MAQTRLAGRTAGTRTGQQASSSPLRPPHLAALRARVERWNPLGKHSAAAAAEARYTMGAMGATLTAMALRAWGTTRPEEAFAVAKSQPDPL